jgi:serine protease Do
MKFWKTAAWATGLVAAAGLGAVLTPAAYGQTRAPRAEVFAFGGGSRLGVSISDVNADDSKGKGTAGVVIDDVDPDSAASKAGLRKGDVVVEFDGERVRSVRQFTRLVSETPAGRTVSAAVMRDGQRVSVSVTPREGNNFRFLEGDNWMGVQPPPIPARPPSAPRPPSPRTMIPPSLDSLFWRSGNRLGITVEELSPQLADYFGTKDGVLVSSVETDSAAAKAGLKAGDVITTVNGSSVESSSELRQRLSNADGGEEFTLGITRDKRGMTLKGKIENRSERRRTTRTVL